MNAILDLIGKIWAAPFTAVGLLIGVVSLPFVRRISIGHNAIQFEGVPRLLVWNAYAAASGNVILYATDVTPPSHVIAETEGLIPIGRHEEAHTYQYQVLGPLFGLVYLLLGGSARWNPLRRAPTALRWASAIGGPACAAGIERRAATRCADHDGVAVNDGAGR
jgi:hypothetical protein